MNLQKMFVFEKVRIDIFNATACDLQVVLPSAESPKMRCSRENSTGPKSTVAQLSLSSKYRLQPTSPPAREGDDDVGECWGVVATLPHSSAPVALLPRLWRHPGMRLA